MRLFKGLLLTSVVSLFDVVLTTVLYSCGNRFHQIFKLAFFRYSFESSVSELWILCVLRCSVILGLIFGIIVGRELGINRIKSTRTISVLLAGIFAMFTLIKLLCVSEESQLLESPWFWCLFAWTLVSSVILILQWSILGNICIVVPPVVKVNCDGEQRETEALLGDKEGRHEQIKEEDKKPMDAKSTILRLFSFSKPDWMFISAGFIFLTLSATGEIFIPFYTGKVVDGIVIDKSQKEFTHAIIVMALISVGSAVTAGLRGGCLFLANRRLNLRIRNTLFSSILKQEVGFFDNIQTAGIRGGCFTLASDRLNIRIRKSLFSSLMRQEVGFFDNIQTGDITSRLTSDTTTMSDTLGLNVNIFLRSLIKAGGVLFFMFKLSWRLTIVTFIGLPCMLAVSKIYGFYYKKLSEEVQDSLASANNVAEEACSTMRTVRSFANEDGEIQRYADKLAVTYKLNKKQAAMYSGFVWSNMLFELSLTVSVLYYGGHLVIDGALTGGTLISFILYQIQLGDCVDSMGYVYTGLMQAAGASEKVFEYIDRKPKISHHGNIAPDDIQGHIQFKDVCFSYPSRPDVPVLKNINFTVHPGEVIALVGPSGGGKTSCVNLLEYFYMPKSGQVLLDNIPIQQYDHHYLHKQISLVGQEPVLYARSIEENISYGLNEDEWSEKMIEEAAEMANAHHFITQLKDGYKTQTGEKGVQMSGGQKQRIAIARALLRKPRVLLLDEATSALDSESEYLVQQALYKNLSGRTVIIIAHRLSTVERADRIIVIDKGEVIEEGTHKHLLSLKGIYSNLVKRQLLLSDNSWSKEGPTSPVRDVGSLLSPHECSCWKRRSRYASGRVSSRHASGNSVLSEEDGTGQPNVTFIVGSI